ncbi:hypothetical protein NSA47_11950 [Irregularibacter muris]|uniref:Uncharacterized protein n=1 Tax=Irregularibacter muris TaxID=1796619 RepID=A0AAE3HIX3_9FIRM|nr:hypothetical protein [Irregularibacter muris]MCR1899689.1 hypothetical protein [Irregularibacter muris]
MHDQINEGLKKAQEGIYRLEKIKSMLKELEEEKQSLEQRMYPLETILKKEDLDVEKLERKSLTQIFHSVLGNLEKQLEKEKSEALAARLKYHQAVKDLENIKDEISKLSSEKMKYIDYPTKYDLLYAQKKDMLIKTDLDKGEKILDLTKKINDAENNLTEIEEAIRVGKDVISHLENISGSLESAENWGLWDMFGGGLLTDLAKHSHLDDAKDKVEKTQELLRKFKTELTDVKITEDINIHIDGFSKFADFFFDGLVSDWFMQSKIQNSHKSVLNVSRQVQDVIDRLYRLEEQEVLTIERLQQELEHLITP